MTDLNQTLAPDRGGNAHKILPISKAEFETFLGGQSAQNRMLIAAHKFTGAPGDIVILPDGDNLLAVLGVKDPIKLGVWCLAKLPDALPAGEYRLEGEADASDALLGWALAQYRFTRYSGKAEEQRVLLTQSVKAIEPALSLANATAKVRDLVNTPAEDMGPAELEAEIAALAKAYNADMRVTAGDALEQGYPLVHAVGRAAQRKSAPRIIELEWGNPAHPRVAIVGKGVCFDTGGLDIKPSSGMLLMKKDMGGAAHAIALAQLIMEAALPIRLHLLVPAVENAIAGNAMRPSDIFQTRAGLSVEIGNTDAEGRLILADALTRACEDTPELIIDFATLTGAARVALGPDLPAMFARDDATAEALLAAGLAAEDPCWRLPLHEPYKDYLKSDIADINNSHTNGYAGASVAALFLDRFVAAGTNWVHFDTFAWRPVGKPGRPKGGEALGLRATFQMISRQYGTS